MMALFGSLMMSTPGFGSDHGGVLQLELERLQRSGRVLYVAAHPDDENTRFIAWAAALGRHQVAYLSLTRGDGGQNRIGSEIGDALGVIRSMELGRARSIDGGQQFFTRARDFGYSKSASESIEVWDHDAILADVVWVFRRFRPHVVVTRFPETGQTHGHHLASAILAREAFHAAGSEERFPEQLKSMQPWTPSRLLYNQPSWWRKQDDPFDLEVDVSGYVPQLGLSIAEIAAMSRTSHKSQGFGSGVRRDRATEYFSLVEGSMPEKTLLSGVDIEWHSQDGGAALGEALSEALAAFRISSPNTSIPGLARALRASSALTDGWLRREVQSKVSDLMVRFAAFRIDVRADAPTVAPGGLLELVAETELQSNAPLKLNRLALVLDGAEHVLAKSIGRTEHAIRVSETAPISRIGWLLGDENPASWSGLADVPVRVRADLEVDGVPLSVERPVFFSNVDPVHGEREQVVRIEPSTTVTPERTVMILRPGLTHEATFKVKSARPRAHVRVEVRVPAGVKVIPAHHEVEFERPGETKTVQFGLSALLNAPSQGKLVPLVDNTPAYSRVEIDYPHLPPMIQLEPSEMSLVSMDLNLSRLSGNIGYVQGTGDRVEDSLSALGLRVETLAPLELTPDRLSRLQALVLGVRAFNVHPVLFSKLPTMLKFVERGGTLVVQYNTNNRIDGVEKQIGPYPFTIGRKRVTDQHARVAILNGAAEGPHRLSQDDFAGWVQERGLYFASTWDARYQTPFEMRDPGEPPQRGSTLVARYGKGRYVYTGLSFFRQLPAGVPGAYRLWINLLSGHAR